MKADAAKSTVTRVIRAPTAAILTIAMWAGPVAAATGEARSPAAGGAEEPAATQGKEPATAGEAVLRAIVADYVGLYRADTLERWKNLFHPALSVADPRPDGTVRVRGLEEFYAAQKAGFAAGRIDGERLENVRIEPGRKIARVTADYIFTGEGKPSRGKLGLHLAEEGAGWKIVAIVFSYDEP